MPEIAIPDYLQQLPPSVWWALGLLVGVPLLLRIIALRRVRGITFRPGGVALSQATQVPEHQRPILEEASKHLQALGFQFWGTIRDESQLGPDHARWWLVFSHSSPATLARVAVSHEIERLTQCEMFLSSWRQTDGRYIDTHPRPVTKALPLPEDAIANGKTFASLTDQWRHHQKRLEPMQADIVFPDAHAWLARADEQGRGDLARLAGLGYVKPGREPGTYRLKLGAAWRASGEAMAQGWRQFFRSTSKPTTEYPPQVLAELDFDHWRREQAKKATSAGMSVWSKLIMLAASIAASAWAMKGGEMDEKAILGVLAVLMVHELGHFLAMWIFGYRNLGILFIPFFGAVAVSGRKPDVPSWKEIAVVLAGPVPGLIAGVAAIYFDYWGHAWLKWPACFSVILNALNLLPVLPMDGGHLLRLAIRARWPRLQALLQTLSALGMICMGLFTGKVLLYLGVAQLLRLGVPWFVASVVRREHRAFSRVTGTLRDPHDDEAAHRQAFYSIWAHPKYRKQPAAARQVIAMQIGEELRARPAGLFATCAALLGCTCLFWSPIAAWFGVGIYAEHQIAKVQQENTATGVPATMEEAREQSVCLPDPVNAKRWAAIMRVVALVDAQSPVLKAIDTINAEATIRAQREASARPAAGDEDTDPVVLRKGELDALSPTLPEEVPEPLARFIADLRLAVVNEPEDLSADAATMADDFNLNPLGLLCRDARRHLKSGRLAEWKTDVLACARALECAPGMTQSECDHREIHVGQLIAVVEEGWPLLVKQPDATFVRELSQRLPTPDELMRQRAVAVFTDEPIGMDLNVVAIDGGVDLSAVSKFTDWLNHSPPARMLYLEGLKQRRVLWQALTAQGTADWQTLCANVQTKLGSIAMLAPPEVATLVNLGTTYQTQQRSLRPSWELFLAAAKMQGADSASGAKLAKNYPREKLSDGSEALVIKPTKREGDVFGFFAPQPVVWRLKN